VFSGTPRAANSQNSRPSSSNLRTKAHVATPDPKYWAPLDSEWAQSNASKRMFAPGYSKNIDNDICNLYSQSQSVIYGHGVMIL
jgi:hypothetical protein